MAIFYPKKEIENINIYIFKTKISKPDLLYICNI